MGENPFQPPAAALDVAADLGPVVLSCRDRSEKERLEAMDQGLLGYYLLPLFIPIVLVGLALLALEKLGMTFTPGVVRVILGVAYVVICGGYYWQLLRRPRKPSLVLHERGFRFKRTVARFDDLATIRFGRDFSAVESAIVSVNRVMGWVSRKNAMAVEMMERSRELSVTLEFKTGEAKLLNGILVRPLPEDLKQFFDRLRAIRPGLVEDMPASSPITPSLDDLPFKMTSV